MAFWSILEKRGKGCNDGIIRPPVLRLETAGAVR